jgi:hypothetical protein
LRRDGGSNLASPALPSHTRRSSMPPNRYRGPQNELV